MCITDNLDSRNHDKDDEITWTATLGGRRPVGGVVVDWAYSPGEFKVMLGDGYKWHEAQPWTRPWPLVKELFSWDPK